MGDCGFWFIDRLQGLRADFKPCWFLTGLLLCLLASWWLTEAWAMGDMPRLLNALVGCLLPGLALLYRGLRPVNTTLTLGCLLIWLFLAGLSRSVELPDTLLTIHTLVGCGLFLLPGLVLLRIAAWEAAEETSYQRPSYDGRYRGPNLDDDDGPPTDSADWWSTRQQSRQQQSNQQQSGQRQSRRETPRASASGESRRRACLQVLGLTDDATTALIRGAYRREIARYHPDRVAQLGPELVALAERKAAEVNLAFDFLVRRHR